MDRLHVTSFFFFFFCITLKPRVEWYKSLWALTMRPPRNRFTFVRSSCYWIENVLVHSFRFWIYFCLRSAKFCRNRSNRDRWIREYVQTWFLPRKHSFPMSLGVGEYIHWVGAGRLRASDNCHLLEACLFRGWHLQFRGQGVRVKDSKFRSLGFRV